jgi:hypothetical protein
MDAKRGAIMRLNRAEGRFFYNEDEDNKFQRSMGR